MKTKVYLIGDKDAVKNNSYDAMTNCLNEAERLVSEIQGGLVKTIEVSPKRGPKR